MRIHTLTGDIIDLRFIWPSGTMHVGRQAARRYAERMEQVVAMRTDDGRAGGWEEVVANETSPDGATRTVRYAIVAALTDDERAIPKAALFVRDKEEPMANLPGERLAIDFVAEDEHPERNAIVARYLTAINAAINPSETP